MRSPYLSNPNILAHPDRIVETVALDLTAQETYLAGSPINAEGKLANDETAIGILLYDVRKRAGGKRGVVVVSGRINQEAAAAWCGVTISDAAKSALVNITFSDDGARMGGGSGGVNSWNDLKDRPFYSEYEDTVLLPKTAIEFTGDSKIFNFEVALEVGQEYTVIWDGVEYKKTAFSSLYYDMTFVVVGNASLFGGGDNTGEPFAIGSVVGAGLAGAFTSTPGVTSEAEIKTTKEIVHPMENKYLDLDWFPGAVQPDASVILAETTFEGSTLGYNLDGLFADMVAKYSKMKVVYDGETYEFDVKRDGHICYVGNGSLRQDYYPDSGEPFCVVFTGIWSSVYTVDDGTTHTISVSGVEQNIPLPAQYNGDTPYGILIKASDNYDIYRITVRNGSLVATKVMDGN